MLEFIGEMAIGLFGILLEGPLGRAYKRSAAFRFLMQAFGGLMAVVVLFSGAYLVYFLAAKI